ncbi:MULTISPECIES: hypothetical protein [Citrobacter]|nr:MULTISPECIES: hypothetical protein [Citrobacter]
MSKITKWQYETGVKALQNQEDLHPEGHEFFPKYGPESQKGDET